MFSSKIIEIVSNIYDVEMYQLDQKWVRISTNSNNFYRSYDQKHIVKKRQNGDVKTIIKQNFVKRFLKTFNRVQFNMSFK